LIIDNKRAVTRVSAGIKSPVVFSGCLSKASYINESKRASKSHQPDFLLL